MFSLGTGHRHTMPAGVVEQLMEQGAWDSPACTPRGRGKRRPSWYWDARGHLSCSDQKGDNVFFP